MHDSMFDKTDEMLESSQQLDRDDNENDFVADGSQRLLANVTVKPSPTTNRMCVLSVNGDSYNSPSSMSPCDLQLVVKRIQNSRRAILNVGGQRHEVMWSALERIPKTRLGRLRLVNSAGDILQLCDDFRLIGDRNDVTHAAEDVEFFFDRDARSFGSVLNLYRTGERENMAELSDFIVRDVSIRLKIFTKFGLVADSVAYAT